MDAYVIVLRLLHVVGGLVWAGSALYGAWFAQPAARAAGEAGSVYMRHLMGETRLPAVMGASAVSTLVSGVLLYWYDFGAVVPFNATMAGYAVGGVAAITAWVLSVAVLVPSGRRMGEFGARAAAGEDVAVEMRRTSRRMQRSGSVAMWLIVFAVVCMAVARYL